jgi:hypothetical protein
LRRRACRSGELLPLRRRFDRHRRQRDARLRIRDRHRRELINQQKYCTDKELRVALVVSISMILYEPAISTGRRFTSISQNKDSRGRV